MAYVLRADSFPETNLKERLALDADAAAAATSLTLETAEGLAVDDFLYVGILGVEGCEKVKVTAVSGDTVTIAAPGLVREHKKFEPITSVYGDQVKIYRASNVDGSVPADGSFASVATRSIDPDQQSTYYSDSTGSSSYWYKVTYINSLTSAETNLAASVAFRGDDYGHYVSLSEIRRTAGFMNNPNIQDSLVDEKRQAAEGEVDAALSSFYTVPFTAPVAAVIKEVTVELAAGLLQLVQYGHINNGSNKDGDLRCKKARAVLTRLQGEHDADGNPPIYLTDYQGTPVPRQAGVSSWPDSTTADADVEDGGNVRSFRMGMKF